jgi:hypothetical protein
LAERINLSAFETEPVQAVMMKLTWYLEMTAEQIDIWFPNDDQPIVQDDLRRLARVVQRRFGYETLREMLGPEKAERLIDRVKAEKGVKVG